ncbi:NAD(P)/FAD-dependent oxidoreductase [Phycisphaera mikurensis]|uniref:Putative oxidoreductase n=1 Tax=Phycisphaera mikurensis (strain NBRC 102666 / KCTC 22515 / FYK2301M01) TaxID=1142394 RepID=I0IIT7_PHYMF|nr:tryptophan 7-halogenase [Phycisphaera mikurensis]MBB6442681.1 flavin-dependent dehydrogenase [Phycisphaera mikurensis]BAM05175.1 putative oxidoreductase [Phycisphaera mikurensis NBRC 102666]
MAPNPHPGPGEETLDAVVVGGGPGGAVAALCLARSGRRVAVLERETGPHFHVGESLLPEVEADLARLGLAERAAALPRVPKPGVTFVSAAGTAPGRPLRFADALDADPQAATNTEREPFDAWLLQEAADGGADVRRGVTVRGIERLGSGGVRLSTTQGPVSARCLIDASGQATLAARHLERAGRGFRRNEPGHERTAYFGHFTGVERSPMPEGGHLTVVMLDEGWFWIIPIDDERTGIGVVLPAGLAREQRVKPDRVLAWAIARCPEVARRTRDAAFPDGNRVAADFSYRCGPTAGPGHLLVGDAAAFIDPVFSGGVSIAIKSGRWAAEAAEASLAALDRLPADASDAARAAAFRAPGRRYARRLAASHRVLFSMIRSYYRPAYRDLLHHGEGPLGVHRASLELLTGRAFPRARFSVRWRMVLMKAFACVQEHVRLVPPLPRWSLVDDGVGGAPAAGPADGPAVAETRPPAEPPAQGRGRIVSSASR